ncbi:hypothetical protein BDM02DRAFT_3132194 [Thelephora ganbajun]|uniref:Uncharacterized protein n=1 Tax=Thelephora ganbajun TaxID=370292 RepID=A0ACB6Z2M6_THEGA|nr:hypothetical protein BDM02DRAFT_3132194 [Thelephora ganbajun]
MSYSSSSPHPSTNAASLGWLPGRGDWDTRIFSLITTFLTILSLFFPSGLWRGSASVRRRGSDDEESEVKEMDAGNMMVEEGVEEGRMEEEEFREDEERLWSPNSSDCVVLALIPDASAFPTQ